jgi:hypothetical protein
MPQQAKQMPTRIHEPWVATQPTAPALRDAFAALSQPADIAEELWHVAHQPRSAWSFVTEVRPFNESW